MVFSIQTIYRFDEGASQIHRITSYNVCYTKLLRAIYGGAYYYDARDAVCTAIVQIQSGVDPEIAFQEAQDTVEFQMGK